jgi:hypothetical protein
MSYRAWFDGLSALRRLAFWIACVSWVIWAVWFRFAFSDAAIAHWSHPAVAAFVLLGAAASAVVIVEMVRILLPRRWPDAQHFTVVGATVVVLFGVQYTGVRLALQAFNQ